jgi:NAD(P)-dependent dehydrogenase (short-subunit alcohol dehydrogenase family)
MIDFGLSGKRAVVSGAGSIPGRAGHGLRCALRLAEAGATIACIDIDEGRANETVSQIVAIGGHAIPIVADMTIAAEVERALDDAVSSMGGIDVCVDIIGRATWNPVEVFTDEDWHYAISQNLTQVFFLFRSAGRHMIAQGTGGSLVAIASVDGLAAAAYHVAYGAAKSGVISLARTFADELGRHGIRANAVAPGAVGSGNEDQNEDAWAKDPRSPLLPPRASDVANAVLFLSSSLAGRITGQTLVVDGGTSMKSFWGMTPESIDAYRQY